MMNFDFGLVADALLSLCERNPEAPFYTEQDFRVRDQREVEKGNILSLEFALMRRDDEMFRRECETLFELAKLTPRQTQVMTLRLEAWSFERIGVKFGGTKQANQRIFMQGIKKLCRALRVYPYTGLSEIYRRETKRGLVKRKAA